MPLVFLVALIVFVASCGTAAPQTNLPSKTKPPKTQLLVSVVFDQLGTWALEQYLPYLDKDGAIRSSIREGTHSNVRYRYAGTLTSPGHLAIFSATTPSENGVFANRYWDYENSRKRIFVDHGKHAIIGAENYHASPIGIRVETVGDILHKQSDGQAKIVSLSLKEYAAILSGGKHADLCLWYNEKSERPGFTSSSYYMSALPNWLTTWSKQRPIETLLVPWKPESPAKYEKLLGDDDAPGESPITASNWLGMSGRFPHDPRNAKKPYEALAVMPQMSERLLQLADKVAEQLELGADEVPDLLAISISGTDKTGHIFGTDSWEYLDHLIRADRALGVLFRKLKSKARVHTLITSDHGSVRLPEKTKTSGQRVTFKQINDLDKKLRAQFGNQQWLELYEIPFVYLTNAARKHPKYEEILSATIDHLKALDGIRDAFDSRVARTWKNHRDALKHEISLQVPKSTGDIFVLVEQNSLTWREHGTTHGTPWDYDRQVPVIIAGEGISH